MTIAPIINPFKSLNLNHYVLAFSILTKLKSIFTAKTIVWQPLHIYSNRTDWHDHKYILDGSYKQIFFQNFKQVALFTWNNEIPKTWVCMQLPRIIISWIFPPCILMTHWEFQVIKSQKTCLDLCSWHRQFFE